MLQLLVTAKVPSSLILSTLIMEPIHSSETLVLTRATWHQIQEDGILHSHCCENLKSYRCIDLFYIWRLYYQIWISGIK
jgi:hypothetical protein